jgi:DNA-binding response OmpR family regulator
MKILLADDDADIREMATHLLGRRGWDVSTVTNGEEAAEALAGETYDIAVLDQNMPPGSGLEVAAERRLGEDAIPIILWTGWAGLIDRDETERLDVHVVNKAEITRLASVIEELAGVE